MNDHIKFSDLSDDIIISLMGYNSNIKFLNKYFYDIYEKNKEHMRKIFIYTFGDEYVKNDNIILSLNKYEYIGFMTMLHSFDPKEYVDGCHYTTNGMLSSYSGKIQSDTKLCSDIDIRIPDEDLTDIYDEDKSDEILEYIRENYEVKNHKIYLLSGPDGFISVMIIHNSSYNDSQLNDILSGIEIFNELQNIDILEK